MSVRRPLSLKHEYELYVEEEIERYKDSIPRVDVLRIGDEAVAALRAQEQAAFDELILWAEVDRIIFRRLRLPSYSTWRRRRLKRMAEMRRPERWGLVADAPLVRAIHPSGEAHVLVSHARLEGSALYLAANGCEVTALEEEAEVLDRVLVAAEAAGLAPRVHGERSPLAAWSPRAPLTGVVCTPAAFAGLSADERARVIDVLKGATLDGGVHLVETIVAGQSRLSVPELESRYLGWNIRLEGDAGASTTFVATKALAS